MGKFFISEFLEQALFWFTPMALSGTLRRGRRGCVPAPQRSRLAHARSWAPRLPRRLRRERECGVSGSGPQRARALLGAMAAMEPLSRSPAPAGAGGCLVLNRAALCAVVGPEPHPLRGGCRCSAGWGVESCPVPEKVCSLPQQNWFLFC